MIVRIIVGFSIICRGRGLRQTTQTEAVIMIAIMKKTEFDNSFIFRFIKLMSAK